MNKTILVTAVIMGFFAVAFGAFAAHGLKAVIDSDSVATFETGVKYQMYYALMLLIIGNVQTISIKQKRLLYYLALIGVLLFSGSIYLLSTNDLTQFDFTSIAIITPIGGVLLLAVWVVLLIGLVKGKTPY